MEGGLTIKVMLARSWARSREILFPFRFISWLRVLIVVWFAGAGIHGCSMNFNIPQRASPIESRSEKVVVTRSSMIPSAKISSVAGALPSSSPALQKEMEQRVLPDPDPGDLKKMRIAIKRWGIWAVAGLGVLGLILGVFFTWLSCRFNFMLLDVIIVRGLTTRGSFSKHKEAGDSYFVWTMAFAGIGLLSLLLAGLIMVLSFGIAKWIPLLGIPLMGLGGLAILAIIAMMIFVWAVMRDFVLPVMYSEGIPAMEALNKFLDSPEFSFGKVFQYLLVTFGLWALLAIIQTVVSVLVGIVGVIAGGLTGLLGWILYKIFPFLHLPLIVSGALLAVLWVFVIFGVIGMIMLPAVLLLRAFALAYLTRLYPECDLLRVSEENA